MAQRKPYNPNTKYGRRKLRDQAQYNYDNGTPEYRSDIDNIKTVVWAVILVICAIIFIIIWNLDSPEAAIKWLK